MNTSLTALITAFFTTYLINTAGYSDDDIEEMKLKDGIKLHERRKSIVYKYCIDNQLEQVKPVVLIACKDTTHARKIKEKIESMNVKINYFNIEKDKQLLFNYIKEKEISFVYCAASVEFSRQIMNILNSVDKNIKLSISNNNLICCGEGICGACIVDLNGKKVKTCKAQIDSREYLTYIK